MSISIIQVSKNIVFQITILILKLTIMVIKITFFRINSITLMTQTHPKAYSIPSNKYLPTKNFPHYNPQQSWYN